MEINFFIFACLIFVQSGIGFGQVTTSTTTSTSRPMTTTTPQWLNPYIGGIAGNPGANIHVSNKTVDAYLVYAADMIGQKFQNMSMANFEVPIGFGILSIKPPRISEAKWPNFENQMLPPNRIRSRFYGGRLVASGNWSYKSMRSNRQPSMSGQYRATVQDGELETTSQLGRSTDAKPMIQTIDCNANFSRFKIDIQGAGNLTTVENCENPMCDKIRGYFEDAACQILRMFVKETVNRHLATFPARVNILDDQYKVDYGLQNNEPIVLKDHVDVGLEAKYLWRGQGSVSFNPPNVSWVDKKRMQSFALTDFVFNSLFQQTHSQGYRFSAAEFLSKSPSIQDVLWLNCSSASPKNGGRSGRGGRVQSPANMPKPGSLCLGSLLENFTNMEQFSANDTGDLVYKTNQKAPFVYIQSNGFGYFDGGVGNLEIYGPAKGPNGNRQLLARFDVPLMRGEFTPKWNGANITGSVKITRLHVDKLQSQPTSMTTEWLGKLSQVAVPTLIETFNSFLNTYAQFPMPLLAGYKCTSPEFIVLPRTMQVDCDLVLTEKAILIV